MSACAPSLAELNHDHANAKNSVNEYFIAVEQMEKVSEAAARILAGHSIALIRQTSRFDAALQKSVPAYAEIQFRMDHVTDLVRERITNEICAGLSRGEPFALRQMQKLVRECAEEVAFDALDFDSAPFLDIDSLREVAEQAE